MSRRKDDDGRFDDGRWNAPGVWYLPKGVTTFLGLVERWLADRELADCTRDLYRGHMVNDLIPWFDEALENITPASIDAYVSSRLKVTLKSTVKKERSTLSGFLRWCKHKQFVSSPPLLPEMEQGVRGKAHPVRRRGKATELSPEECQRLIAALPEWSSSKVGKKPFAVRARFIVMYETGLRPHTLDMLRAPEHYCREEGAKLTITDDIDKAKFGRDLPLTLAAQAALASVYQTRAPLFGKHDYRWHLDAAARLTLSAQKAATFCAYDLRHARATELVEKSANLPGTAYLLGHKKTTTTALYVKPGLKAARRTLEACLRPRVPRDGGPTSWEPRLVGYENRVKNQRGAKERTRTSMGVNPLAPQASSPYDSSLLVLLRTEAVELMRLASTDSSVEYTRMLSFARAVLELSEVGTLALGVLDGGPLALARCLALAQLIVSEDEPTPLQREEGES